MPQLAKTNFMSLGKLILIISMTAGLGGCQQAPHFLNINKTKILASTEMAADLVRNLTDINQFQVIALMGPGVDPHLYKPTAGDIQRISDADLIVYGGLHLEGRMSDAFHQLHNKSFGIGDSLPKEKVRLVEDNMPDPHVWLDLQIWDQIASNVAKELIRLRPDQKESISQKLSKYQLELKRADQEAMKSIQSIPPQSRILVTAHDAFQYFGARYGIEVMGIQGTNTAAEASPKRIQELADLIAAKKVKAIFVESSVSPALVNALKEAVLSRNWKITIGPPTLCRFTWPRRNPISRNTRHV